MSARNASQVSGSGVRGKLSDEKLRGLIDVDRAAGRIVVCRSNKINRAHYADLLGCTPSALTRFKHVFAEYERELSVVTGPMRHLSDMREWLTAAYSSGELKIRAGKVDRAICLVAFGLHGGNAITRHPCIRTLFDEFDARVEKEGYLPKERKVELERVLAALAGQPALNKDRKTISRIELAKAARVPSTRFIEGPFADAIAAREAEILEQVATSRIDPLLFGRVFAFSNLIAVWSMRFTERVALRFKQVASGYAKEAVKSPYAPEPIPMRLPTPAAYTGYATWQKRPVRFGLHTASTHAGPSVPFREPWGYLRFWIRDNYPQSTSLDGLELAKQAERFYRIASSASSDTSPLLWYYCFLNLSKALLLKTPSIYKLNEVEHATHGIADPSDNSAGYVTLNKQKVTVYSVRTARTPAKLQIFPALCEALGTPISFAAGESSADLSIKSLLSHIVSVHRAFATAYNTPLRFCKAEVTAMERRAATGKSGDMWHLLRLESLDVKASGGSIKAFELDGQIRAVAPGKTGYHDFESISVTFSNTNFLGRLAGQHSILRKIVHPLLLPQGYRYYLYPETGVLRQPASIYAVMFYLGSIVRYKPQRFASLIGNKYHWLVEEFLQIAPKQFVALLINEITDCELAYFVD